MEFIKSPKFKKILLLVVLVAGIFLISTQVSRAELKDADAFDCSVIPPNLMGCISYGFYFVTYIIFTILGYLINFVSSFIPVLLKLGQEVTSSNFVHTGFYITLQITNLALVLSIVYVAFVTIIGVAGKDYQIKQFIMRLVTVAVVVNFSLGMAGVIIDFNTVLGNYFLAKSTPGGDISKFSEQLANAFDASKLTAIKDNPGFVGSVVSGLQQVLTLILSLFISIFSSICILLTFVGILGFLLMRYIWLVSLLVIMPLIWACYLIPKYHNYFSEWWKKFLHWNFTLPTISFCLYLAMLLVTSSGQIVTDQIAKDAGAQQADLVILNMAGIAGILDMIVKTAFFMAALKFGADLAGGAMKAVLTAAQGAQKKLTGAYTGMLKTGTGMLKTGGQFVKRNTIGRAVNTKAGRAVVQQLQAPMGKTPGLLGTLGRGVLKATGVRTLSSGVGNALSENLLGESEIKSAEDRIKGRSHDNLSRDFFSLNDPERIAALQAAMKAGKLDKYNDVLPKYLKDAKSKGAWERYDAAKDFEKVERGYGADGDTLRAIDKKNKAKKGGDATAIEAAEGELKASFEKFTSTFEPGDIKKLSAKLLTKDEYGSMSKESTSSLRGAWLNHMIKEGEFGALRKAMAESSTEEVAKIFDYASEAILDTAGLDALKNAKDVLKAEIDSIEADMKAAIKTGEDLVATASKEDRGRIVNQTDIEVAKIRAKLEAKKLKYKMSTLDTIKTRAQERVRSSDKKKDPKLADPIDRFISKSLGQRMFGETRADFDQPGAPPSSAPKP